MKPHPIGTYRLQFRPGFGFDQAIDLISYLSDLGISHIYTSPYLQAVEDSTHGYDVADPTQVNSQLGGADAHNRLCEQLQKENLGLMIDVVPNHMAIKGKQNPWWWDVLENGASSRYARYFDVDWEASEERWPNKIMLPVLADHYGRILEKGDLQLLFQDGYFILKYQDHTFPIDPSSLSGLLSTVADACNSELLAFVAESYARLPRPTVTSYRAVERRHRDKAALNHLLNRILHDEQQTNEALETEIKRLNEDPDAMDNLINQQNYRLAFWRTASRDLGYRRFFDIKDLVGLRIEEMEVFQETHALLIAWFQKGWIQGFRIDHPDGLRNPAVYFNRLNAACPNAWIIAEKILEPGEEVPANWKVDGTTGYDFLNHVTELFVDADGEKAFTALYEEVIGESSDFNALVKNSKRQVLRELFGSELNRLTTLFVEVCEKHRRYRDYTKMELSNALLEVAVCFPVYRTYVSASEDLVSEDDEKYISEAIYFALLERPDLDPELFQFLKRILLLRVKGELEGELAMRFQQLTGPAMAKGFEDTALYRYNRLIALNDVGMNPSFFGTSLIQFHEACVNAQLNNPLSLLASTTHDTKRSEDVRARIALLSEIPDQWAEAVKKWMGINEKYRITQFPDRNTEYFLYQTLIGAWPIDESRLTAYIVKAIREAKVYTSWTTPNKEYEEAVLSFVSKMLADIEFIKNVERFIQPLIAYGYINSLSQALIKLTAPGIPDLYQGCEIWNDSLVDPDNRREVDFVERKRLLNELSGLSPEKILQRMQQGLPKLWVTKQALNLRKSHPHLFGPKAGYKPVYAQGTKADHVVAFLRGDGALTVTPRLVIKFNGDWDGTVLDIPEGLWQNILTGERLQGGQVKLETLLGRFPVGLWVKQA